MSENSRKNKLKKWFNVVEHWRMLSTGWKGAAIGLSLVAFILFFFQGYYMIGDRGIADYIIGTIIALVAIIVVAGLITLIIYWLRKLLNKLPSLYLWIALTGFMLIFLCFIGPMQVMFIVTLSIVVSFSLIGMLILRIVRGQFSRSSKLSKIVTGTLAGLALVYTIIGSFWLFNNGDKQLPSQYQLKAIKTAEKYATNLANPTEPGSYQVKTLTYGSADSYRKEFNAEDSLITTPVDGSSFVENWSSIRTKTFGFGPEQMPLNGFVWYPEGEGSFPLVIAVHGNHLATDYSDPGYDYLGEMLASRGYIFVSIDENFLNTSPYNDLFMLKVLEKENRARGWLILEHLKVWNEWNKTNENPFFGKVDMSQIALIGHSRGGEAVAVAALYNQLSSLPEDGNIPFDYHFNIRSIISIAGTDGQYKPGGQATQLQDISYLAIQGSHDMDVSSFDTVNQYERIDFTENSPHFKSAVYIYGANHGQFNTTWGRHDGVGFGNKLYNIAKLMPEDEQLQIAKVLIASFLEATLKQKTEYRQVFQDLGYAKDWLPDTMYISDYWDGNTVKIANFTEDLDYATTTLKGGKLVGNALQEWGEENVKLKYMDGVRRAVRLEWDRSKTEELPSYSVDLPTIELTTDENSSIVFSIADRDERKREEDTALLDLSVQVEDRSGNIASLPLSDIGVLLPMFEGDIVKRPFTSFMPTKEPIFQYFSIQLSEFTKANAQFESQNISKISFVFDKTEKGSVYLTNIGIK